MVFTSNTFLISGRNTADSWERAIRIISQQPEIVAGEDYVGTAKKTRDCTLLIELDEEAVEEILNCEVHPAFEQGKQAIEEYAKEYTYSFVKNSWELPEVQKFDYNYMDRLVNYPIPLSFRYNGNILELDIPEQYLTKDKNGVFTGGIDQIKIVHDAIRKDGISRRHELITWIPAIDLFNSNPPCAQRLWIRVLVEKSEYIKYRSSGGIPVEVAIEYRSWDIGRAILSNLYGICTMLNKYIFSNITEFNEIKNGELNTNYRPEYKIHKLKLFGNACHVYEDSYNIFDLKPREIFDNTLYNNC
jgi:thymidylate synthase